jgi:uncharacterized protein (DUF2141 family)
MLAALAASMLAALAASDSTEAADLTVTLTDIRASTGTIRVAVVDSEAAWNNEAAPVVRKAIPAAGKEATFHFPGLTPGQYAVQVMHDENDNGKFDTNFVGLPTEGYGFSNNPHVMRRAHYDEARFELGPDGGSVVVHLR